MGFDIVVASGFPRRALAEERKGRSKIGPVKGHADHVKLTRRVHYVLRRCLYTTSTDYDVAKTSQGFSYNLPLARVKLRGSTTHPLGGAALSEYSPETFEEIEGEDGSPIRPVAFPSREQARPFLHNGVAAP
jgi:hypothetical protein